MANYYLNSNGSITKNKKQSTGKNYYLTSDGSIKLREDDEEKKRQQREESIQRLEKASERNRLNDYKQQQIETTVRESEENRQTRKEQVKQKEKKIYTNEEIEKMQKSGKTLDEIIGIENKKQDKMQIARPKDIENLTTVKNSDVKAYKQAKKLNQALEDKDYASAIAFVGSGITEGLNRGTAGIANAGLSLGALGLESLENRIAKAYEMEEKILNKYGGINTEEGQKLLEGLENTKGFLTKNKDKLLDKAEDFEDRTSVYSKTLPKVNSGIVGTGGQITSAVGEMIPAILSNIVLPGSGAVVSGTQVGGNSAVENLDEGRTNLDKSVLTGTAKGIVAGTVEKLTGGDIISEGFTDKLVAKGIGKTTSNKVVQNVIYKAYQVMGEQAEELLEDDLSNVIDKVVNNKDFPTFQERLSQAGETAKVTGLTTLLLNALGLGGGNIDTVLPTANQKQSKQDTIQDVTPVQEQNMTPMEKATNEGSFTKQQELFNNIENNQETLYNNNERESGIDGDIERYINEGRNGLHQKQENNQNREYSWEEYNQWEQSIKPIEEQNLTESERQSIINAKSENNKDIILYDENSNDNTYSGGASQKVKNKIVISKQKAEIFGLTKMIDHETAESDILHNEIANDILTPIIETIEKDTNFTKQKDLFWEGQEGNVPSNKLIAKDILCDRFSELKNGEKLDYENILSNATNSSIDMALNNYYKQVYGKELGVSSSFYVENNKNIAPSMKNNSLPVGEKSKQRVYPLNNNEVVPDTVPKIDSSFLNETTSTNSIIPQNGNVNYTNNYAQESKNDTQINQNVAPSVENNVLPVSEYTKQKNDNEKQRKHYKSIMQSQYSSDEARAISKSLMGTDTYIPESNNKQLERADERIRIGGADSELNSLMSRAMTGGNIKADDIAVGERLIQYYSKIGDKEKLSEAIQATAMAGTTAGQTVQAMSLLNHQTPEGQAIWLQRSIEKMNNSLKSKRGENSQQFNLTPEMTEKIVNSKNTEELQKNLNEVYEELGQQVSKSTIQKIDAWRYFAMLANPKTHIRNIVGNAAMSGTQSVKNKVAGIIEGTVAKFNPEMERNHTVIPVSEEIKNFAKSDIINVADRLGLNENKYNPKTRLENSMRTFKSDTMEKTIGKAFDLNDKALEVEDGWGLKSAYARALSEYMTSNKLKPNTITDTQLSKARNYAIEQAKEATFHQESNLATLLNQLSNKNNFTKFVMDATLPFKKTPINVAKAGLEYSPVGLVKSAIYDTAQLRKGNITVNKYIDNISKGLTGTGIALIGYALASCGVLKASGSDDKDKEGFDEARGNQTYSIKIGDNTYSLDWLSPAGIPLFIGAECYEIGQEAKKENTSSSDEDSMYNKIVESATNVLDSFTNAMNPMTEMSMLSGLTSAIKSYDGDNSKMLANIGINAGKSYINQFVPTTLSQIARTTDKYERNTTSTKTGTLPKAIDSSKNYIMSKIPGLRQMLPKKTDVWGNEIKQSENILLRATENSLFPWTRKEISTNNVDNAILKVYESTGENSVFPDSINKNITIDGEKYIMTSGEYAKYQRQYGETSYTLLNNLVNSNAYRKMSNDQKQNSIENVYSYAKEQIKIDYAKQNKLEFKESTLSKTINAIKKTGGNTGNFLEYTALTKDLKKDSEKIELLANANYSNNTKKAIYENSLGEEDTTYNIVKGSFTEGGLNITKYLKYKNQDFSADRKDDGTIKGQPISGSKKEKVWNYIRSIPGATNTQKLLLYSLQYEPSTYSQKQQVVNYIKSLNGYTSEEKMELLSKLKGITIYKNGKYDY